MQVMGVKLRANGKLHAEYAELITADCMQGKDCDSSRA
jgi:hypothetical protein